MKIGIVSPNFPPMPWPCGAADFVARYARGLAESGQDVTVLTTNAKAEPQGGDVTLQVMPGHWGLGHQRRMAAWIARQGFDVVDLQYEAAMYGHSARPLWFPAALAGRSHALVLTLHSQSLPRRLGRLARPFQLMPYDAVVFYSAPFYENMARRFPKLAGRFTLLGFPANILDTVSPAMKVVLGKVKAGALGSELLFVYFGHISPNRGIEDVLAAVADLRGRGLKPQLALMSQFDPGKVDYHRQLLDKVRADGLADQVTFTGTLGADEVSRMLGAADVCVLPFPDGASFKNGSLAAAIEHGVPTVTTVSPLTEPDLLEPGALQTYAPGDRAALTERLATLTDPALRAEARAKTAPLRDKVCWESYIHRRLDTYRGALSSRGRAEAVTAHA